MRFISKIISQQDPVHILPYGGYANDEQLICRARVLEDEGIEYQEDDGRLRNIWNSFKRFESDEISGQLVKASLNDQHIELISDEEGYIELAYNHNLGERPSSMQWTPIQLSLNFAGQAPFEIETKVMRPGQNAHFGIISDVDDTIIRTGVSSRFKWRLLVNSVAYHAFERTSFDKTAEFYTALHKGSKGDSQNPVFYVSNSPWNLHEYLTTYLRYQSFPEGPLLLRDFGSKSNDSGHEFIDGAKYKHITQILNMYPDLPFILLGDAAELDTDIYLHIAEQYPGRISAIYIRAVQHQKHMERIQDLSLSKKGLPIFLLDKTDEAVEHAKTIGLIE